jgi:outer membrane murein-binding lipoprotein Lpp
MRRAYAGNFFAGAIVLAAMLCIGCAGKQEPRQKIARAMQEMSWDVDRQIPDPQRAARLQAAIDRFDADLVEFQGALEKMEADMKAVNARPESSRSDFEKVFADFDMRRKAIRTRLLEHHFEMIAATTAEEWHQLSHHERDALAAVSLR